MVYYYQNWGFFVLSQSLFFASLFLVVSLLLLLRVHLDVNARVLHERRQFRLALDSSAVEQTRFLLLGLLPGLLLSGVLIYAGIVLPVGIVAVLAVLSLLLALPRGFFSALPLAAAGAIAMLLPASVWAAIGLPQPDGGAAPFALMVTLIALAAAGSECLTPYHASPALQKEHGRMRARFSLRQLLWLPLLVPVPGEWLAQLPLSPLMSPGSTGVQFVLLPLVLGFAFTSRDGKLTRGLHRRAWWSGAVALTGLVLAGLSWAELVPDDVVWFGLAAAGIVAAFAQRVSAPGRGGFTAAAGGVRVIGTLAGTPAERMHLQRGDTILDCNGTPVATPRDFYTATQELGTFCRLRVQDMDGRIRLTETAIFAGSPHMLGVITFPEEE